MLNVLRSCNGSSQLKQVPVKNLNIDVLQYVMAVQAGASATFHSQSLAYQSTKTSLLPFIVLPFVVCLPPMTPHAPSHLLLPLSDHCVATTLSPVPDISHHHTCFPSDHRDHHRCRTLHLLHQHPGGKPCATAAGEEMNKLACCAMPPEHRIKYFKLKIVFEVPRYAILLLHTYCLFQSAPKLILGLFHLRRVANHVLSFASIFQMWPTMCALLLTANFKRVMRVQLKARLLCNSEHL